MMNSQSEVKGTKVLILGLTFKENCPDLRNTKVIDVVRELQDYQLDVEVYDPWVDRAEAEQEYGITPIEKPKEGSYGAIIIAVAHKQFSAMGEQGIKQLGKPDALIYDLKYVLPKEAAQLRL